MPAMGDSFSKVLDTVLEDFHMLQGNDIETAIPSHLYKIMRAADDRPHLRMSVDKTNQVVRITWDGGQIELYPDKTWKVY